MPYACEDCGEMGARMNQLFEIRLCSECSKSSKYKLICKSKALSQYLLTNTDLDINPNPPKEYLVKNPHYKSGPPMTLYLETEIQRVFLSKYDDMITNILIIPNPLNDMEKTIKAIENYLEEQKNIRRQKKYQKILDKHNIRDESDLPEWVKKQLLESKSVAEYSRIISSYIRFEDLYKLLKSTNLLKYIDLKVCHEYIYQTNKQIILYQIPNIIRFMLEKKKLISKAIKENNINKSKYSQEITEYINSYDLDLSFVPEDKTIFNDLYTLIEYINKKEHREQEIKLRTKELVEKLKLRGLVLRSDSVLCSNYISGSNEYLLDEVVDIMEQMEWFFTNTPYSTYSKQYDNERYESRKSTWYDYEDRYYNNRYYDSDDSDDLDYLDYLESREKSKQEYNKRKSEYVKRKCLKEWISNGKKGIYPQSLIPLIKKIETELIEEKINP